MLRIMLRVKNTNLSTYGNNIVKNQVRSLTFYKFYKSWRIMPLEPEFVIPHSGNINSILLSMCDRTLRENSTPSRAHLIRLGGIRDFSTASREMIRF